MRPARAANSGSFESLKAPKQRKKAQDYPHVGIRAHRIYSSPPGVVGWITWETGTEPRTAPRRPPSGRPNGVVEGLETGVQRLFADPEDLPDAAAHRHRPALVRVRLPIGGGDRGRGGRPAAWA